MAVRCTSESRNNNARAQNLLSIRHPRRAHILHISSFNRFILWKAVHGMTDNIKFDLIREKQCPASI